MHIRPFNYGWNFPRRRQTFVRHLCLLTLREKRPIQSGISDVQVARGWRSSCSPRTFKASFIVPRECRSKTYHYNNNNNNNNNNKYVPQLPRRLQQSYYSRLDRNYLNFVWNSLYKERDRGIERERERESEWERQRGGTQREEESLRGRMKRR